MVENRTFKTGNRRVRLFPPLPQPCQSCYGVNKTHSVLQYTSPFSFQVFTHIALITGFAWGQSSTSVEGDPHHSVPASLFISRSASLALTLLPRLTSRQLWFTASSSSVTLSKCWQRLWCSSLVSLSFPDFFACPLFVVEISLFQSCVFKTFLCLRFDSLGLFRKNK